MTIARLRLLNNFFAFIAFLLALYLGLSPFIPEVELWIGTIRGQSENSRYATDIDSIEDPGIGEDELEGQGIPDENVLFIPELGIDGIIHEGEGVSTLNKGIWRRPRTSSPDSAGNTVLVAHRSLYTDGPDTFYHLDKMEEGQEFKVFWEGEELSYRVMRKFETSATDVSIEDSTEEDLLTLYTCSPLWTATRRLVVQAQKV